MSLVDLLKERLNYLKGHPLGGDAYGHGSVEDVKQEFERHKARFDQAKLRADEQIREINELDAMISSLEGKAAA